MADPHHQHVPTCENVEGLERHGRIGERLSVDSSAAQDAAEARLSVAASFSTPRDRLSLQKHSHRLRRRSPLSPTSHNGMNCQPRADQETPRMWKERGSPRDNLTRRSTTNKTGTNTKTCNTRDRSVTFSPTPKQRKNLSYFTVQGSLSRSSFEVEPSNNSMQVDEASNSSENTAQGDSCPAIAACTSSPQTIGTQEEENDNEIDSYDAPTVLHELCYNAKSAQDLHNAQALFPHSAAPSRDFIVAASMKDSEGSLPLHILSENTNLSTAIARAKEHNSDASSLDHQEMQTSSSFGLDNSHLFSDRAVTEFVIDLLLPANPCAIMRQAGDGYIPFQGAIVDWVEQAHRPSSFRNLPLASRRSTTGAAAVDKFQHVWMSTTDTVTAAIGWAGRSFHFNRSARTLETNHADDDDDDNQDKNDYGDLNHVEKCLPLSDDDDNDTSVGRIHDDKHLSSDRSRRNHLFPEGVRLATHFRFALKLLSAIVDQLDRGESSQLSRQKSVVRQLAGARDDDSYHTAIEIEFCHDSDEISNTIVMALSSIPDFVKTILLLEDETEFNWVFSCSIIRKVIMDKHSIGPWLTCMLQSPLKQVSRRAMRYLQLISEVSAVQDDTMDYGGGDGRQDDNNNALYDEISLLKGFIPSMLSLDERDIEDVATTPIVKRVLDKMISRPFAVSVVFFDALLLTILITAFRCSVAGFLTGEDPRDVLKWIYVANTCIFYCIIREIGKAISLCMITKRIRIYFLSFWNLTDILATLLALCSTVAMRVQFSHEDRQLDNGLQLLRGCLAVTTGLLWLRVLSLLKTINMQLATFVLAAVQITRDIMWFLLILMALVVAFAQMFYTLLVPSACASQDNASDAQCQASEYYLKVYSILLGDFGTFAREDFHTFFSVLLVVIFTFMVVVVLLNVLIAIVSDSYEKCLVRSQNLFGRARVMLLAELVSFQDLLRKSDDRKDALQASQQAQQQMQGELSESSMYNQWWTTTVSIRFWDQGWSRGSVLFFSLSSSVVFFWMLGEIIGYGFGKRYGNFLFSFGSVLVNVLVFGAIVAFLLQESRTEEQQGGNQFTRCISNWYERFIQKNLVQLMGSKQQKKPFWSSKSSMILRQGEDDEWRGRVHHIQCEMGRLADESARKAQAHRKSIEQHVSISETHIRGEMSNLDERMVRFKNEVVQELRESERRTEDMIRSSLEQMLQHVRR